MKQELYAIAKLPLDQQNFEENILVGWNNRYDDYELYSADELYTKKLNLKRPRNGLVNVYNNYDEIIYADKTKDGLERDLPTFKSNLYGEFALVKITSIDEDIFIEEVK